MEKYARFKYMPCLPLGKDGKRVTASREHIDISRAAAAEGIVLLKNEDNALPLAEGEKIALFGKATIEYVKGGGGSGDVNCPYISGIYEGFEMKEDEGKVSVYMPLIDFYRSYVKEGQKSVLTEEQINANWDIVNNMKFCQLRDDMTYDTFAGMHVKETDVPDELVEAAAGECSTAIFTISRFSAEGTDRRAVGGDYYLSDIEKNLLSKLTANFEKVIIVVNSGAQICCEDFANNNKVKAVLFAWQGGMEGGIAIADVLCGDINPSGKLPDTVTTTYDAYPSKDEQAESFDFCTYSEDIYVGYRYFSTIPGMKKYIRYPFGFGLSYTKFEIGGIIAGESEDRITVAFNVKNIGKTAGKEVVQVYYSAPQGKLGKPAKALAGYAKTKLLAPGENQTLAISFDLYTMASFDDLGKVSKASYILEKGAYRLFIGNSSENLEKVDFEYVADDDIILQKLSSFCTPYELKKRLLADGSFEELPQEKHEMTYEAPVAAPYDHTETAVQFDKVGEEISLDDFINQMTVDEMIHIVGGLEPHGVCQTGYLGDVPRLGIPGIPAADGPAGLHLNRKTGVATTAFPSSTCLAASWNEELIYNVGKAAAEEIRENNIGVWLAPAANIHRNPLCGRNFEYMSEDPVLAGKQVAAEIRGIQSQKVAVSLKHFACNNKEPNRYENNSILSERALREIYLKVFEIAVKEAHPLTIMSSYNLINGTHTSENWELLTGILCREWGYEGVIETDWCVVSSHTGELLAGSNIKMPRGVPEELKKSLEDGKISVDHLKASAARVLNMFTKLGE